MFEGVERLKVLVGILKGRRIDLGPESESPDRGGPIMGSCERGGGVGGLRLPDIRQVQRERARLSRRSVRHGDMLMGHDRKGRKTLGIQNDYV